MMETHVHTPGPWIAKGNLVTQPFVTNQDGSAIADICESSKNPDADAFLIAAAPELLSALKTYMKTQTTSETFPKDF